MEINAIDAEKRKESKHNIKTPKKQKKNKTENKNCKTPPQKKTAPGTCTKQIYKFYLRNQTTRCKKRQVLQALDGVHTARKQFVSKTIRLKNKNGPKLVQNQ